MSEFYLRNNSVKEVLLDYITSLPPDKDRPIHIVVEPYRKSQTREQREMLHAIIGEIADTGRYSAAVWKEFLKKKFLGFEEMVLPTGEKIIVTPSTTSLNREQYSRLIEEVREYAVNELGVKLCRS